MTCVVSTAAQDALLRLEPAMHMLRTTTSKYVERIYHLGHSLLHDLQTLLAAVACH